MSLFGGVSSGPLQRGAQKSNKQLKKGGKKSIQQYKEGLAKASPLYEKAAAQFTPYQQTGTAANTMEANALGLNGQDGYDAAKGAFHLSPGFDLGSEALLRSAASRGQVNSGNLNEDLLNYWSANEWNPWQDRLHALGGQGIQAAQGAAGANMAQGGMTADNFNNRANTVASNYAARANNASQLGLNLTNLNAANDANRTSLIGSGLTALSSLFGTAMGGPAGGALGGTLAKSILG